LGIDLQGDIGGFRGVNSSQTLLAQNVSPPQAAGSNPLGLILLIVGGLFIIFGVGGIFFRDDFVETKDQTKWQFFFAVLGTLFGLTLSITAAYILHTDGKRKKSYYEFALLKWSRQWVCLRCGTRFEPE
jgi:uncharacterized protein involved in exopolysaccharide biosynthesis